MHVFNWREGIDWSVIPKTQSAQPEPQAATDANREFYPFNWREGIDWSLIPKASE